MKIDYKRAVEICKHEVGHEMFARICEKNIELCFNIAKEIEKIENQYHSHQSNLVINTSFAS